MTRWERDKADTDAYLPLVKAICGYYFIGDAPKEEDQDHNTDLIVLNLGGVRIAVRLRKPHYWKQGTPTRLYRDEFTLRNTRPSGHPTEFAKILQGFGDYFFYGFQAPNPPHLLGFGICDLGQLRPWLVAWQERWHAWPGRIQSNGDASSTFRCIRWDMIPPSAIVVMYPAKIAVGTSLMAPEAREAIQLALSLVLET
jgi:hypothetical protein